MPAPLSVIIPALDEAGALPTCLSSLMPGLETGLLREVILVDGGSRDATRSIAEAAGCRIFESDPGRAPQLRCGAREARGRWLLFLHADTALGPNWTERAAAHMEGSQDIAAAFTLAYRSDAPEAQWLAARANRRARWFGLPYGDQGLLISRSFYEAVGGYPDLKLMEDVAIVRAIGKKRMRILSAEARTCAAKYERDGWRRRSYRNAWLLVRYALGAPPERLARHYT
ncbi:MAG: TIGR04283 family arsenosugar biosynthesis glycosyltransferase [Pseudomonadota bacterium]